MSRLASWALLLGRVRRHSHLPGYRVRRGPWPSPHQTQAGKAWLDRPPEAVGLARSQIVTQIQRKPPLPPPGCSPPLSLRPSPSLLTSHHTISCLKWNLFAACHSHLPFRTQAAVTFSQKPSQFLLPFFPQRQHTEWAVPFAHPQSCCSTPSGAGTHRKAVPVL